MRDILNVKAWILALRFALRDLRGGLIRFRIFIACLALGVFAIAAIGSVSSALTGGLQAQGQEILGGDVSIRLVHRQARADELAAFMRLGRVTQSASMRALITPANGESVLVNLKTVDDAYPLYGVAEVNPPLSNTLYDALNRRGGDGAYPAFAAPDLLDRLDVGVGEAIQLGDISLIIIGALTYEPDRAANGFTLGPRLIISPQAFLASGLQQPGSLINYYYQIALSTGSDADALAAAIDALNGAFPEAGWRVRDHRDASPSVRNFIENIGLFLTLVSITALVVGGVGVSNAMRGWLASRRETIAIFKCLGADGRLIFQIYLLQIILISLLAILPALLLGSTMPWFMQIFLDLPVPVALRLYPVPLLIAAGFGLLTGLAFALYPLAVAQSSSAAQLFRSLVSDVTRPSLAYLIAISIAFASLGILVFLLIYLPTRQWQYGAWFIIGIVVSYLLLNLMVVVLKKSAIYVAARPACPILLRLALKNIYRAGAPTGQMVISLGFAVALLSAVALVEDNLNGQIRDNIPARAPSFFLLDVQTDQIAPLRALVADYDGTIDARPILRGRVIAFKNTRAETFTPPANVAWVLRGDRGLTYANTPPPDSIISQGTWWDAQYEGDPLVSLDAGIARGFGLEIGDTLEVNILGRPLIATIANLREIDWSSAALNFAMVFSNKPLIDAPHGFLATVTLDDKSAQFEQDFYRALTKRFANIAVIRVKETITRISQLLNDFSFAVRAMSVLTLLVGILVLAGAIASSHASRLYDAVIFKMLGAKRNYIMACYMLEYALIGFVASVIAIITGTLAAWGFVAFALRSEWYFAPQVLLTSVIGATLLTLAFGLIGTWRVLGQTSAPVLRQAT